MRPQVLLLWPGTDGTAAGNFGCPQLVTMATYIRERCGADVTIVDLYAERVFGPVNLREVFLGPLGKGYDVVGFSVYSSFDFLKMEAIAAVGRSLLPDATFAAGGYHVSARPGDFVYDGSSFDVAIVGEGELSLAKVVEAFAGGAPLRHTILGSDPVTNLDELPETDWSFLDRYKPHVRRFASQIELYLSRGCPFDCAFCMERAKREVSWRPLSVDRAIEEVRRAHAYFDLTGMTVYFADALFGMRKRWRREFLDALAKEDFPARKFWLLVRVDMIDEDDLRQFGRANCSLGFGLESGDPDHLATIRKAGRLHDYLDKMLEISERARDLNVPWGANIIVGHPGETEASLRTSAAYMAKLFGNPRGVTGFLSVDPFRLYPGSPIDDERDVWERRFGTRFHRPEWWKDGDQEFLAEWVDPSADLTYRRRAALTEELVGPTLKALQSNFAYHGPARDYFELAIREQIEQFSRRTQLHYTARYYAWNRYVGKRASATRELATDAFAERLCKDARNAAVDDAVRKFGKPETGENETRLFAIAAALRAVPRERFVPLDAILESTTDTPIGLDATGETTVSALHAYLRTFLLAGIGPGVRVLDLGGGTGYGATILARLVGDQGKVVSIELDPALVATGQSVKDERATLLAGDALDPATLAAAMTAAGGPFDVIVGGFAFALLDPALGAVSRPDTIVVIPLLGEAGQRLTRALWTGSGFKEIESFDPVLYVRTRREADLPRPAQTQPVPAQATQTIKRLPIMK